jgi:ketosteroid isomerase-like protein
MFARGFEAFWQAPDLAALDALLTEDVRLVQPLSRTTFGLQAAKDSFRRLFAVIPDLRGVVDRSRGDDEVLFIEFRLHGTVGARRIEWPLVDRFLLRGEKACERVSYFDPLVLVGPLLRAPLTAIRLLLR